MSGVLPRTQTSLFARCLYPSHGPLRFITSHSFRARLLCHAKNEAPEEEAVRSVSYHTKNRMMAGMRLAAVPQNKEGRQVRVAE